MRACFVGFCPGAGPLLRSQTSSLALCRTDLSRRGLFAGATPRNLHYYPTNRATWKAALKGNQHQPNKITSNGRIRRAMKRLIGITAGVTMFLVILMRGVHAMGLRTEVSPRALRLRHHERPPVSLVVNDKVTEIDGLPLNLLGIDMEKVVGEKQLRSKSWTRVSEAQEELFELEEDRIQFKWLKDVHMFAGALYSLIGLVILYKAGSIWEKWMKEQEQKEIEKEIRLTGTFIDPRANRIPEEEEGLSEAEKKKWEKKTKNGRDSGGGATGLKGKGQGPGSPPSPPKPNEGPSQDQGYNTLDKLLGNN